MKRKILLFILSSCLSILPALLHGQSKYWVVFTDKNGVNFDPIEYFDHKTIEKRIRFGIPLKQFTDMPLREDYVKAIKNYSEISTTSRWLNAVSVDVGHNELTKIETLEFVKEVIRIQDRSKPAIYRELDIDDSYIELARKQLGVMGGDFFREANLDGTGVRIAIFDIGFSGADTLPVFKKIRDSGRIIKTWDFVKENEFVYHYNAHGTGVFSCIAGQLDSLSLGLASGAEFLLARTEIKTEIFKEEEYWAAAMEWADRNGADIINSSLGYTDDRYFPRQMDGKTVYVTRMANIAASKGILVINAAGNDGDKSWEVIAAPADADSVLSVGGISSERGIHISFSSFGPTADGRLKPNVVAFGDVVSAGKNSMKKSYGTSYSAPLVTGFAACVMQLHPEWDNMKVFGEIQKSGHLYPYFDYAHGYGVPQSTYFVGKPKPVGKSFQFNQEVNNLEVKLLIKANGLNGLNVPDYDGQFRNYTLDDQYLYFKIINSKTGNIRKYAVVLMNEDDKFNISLNELKKGDKIIAFYRGYSDEYIFQK